LEGVVESRGDLRDDVGHERELERRVALQQRLQVRSAHVLHRDEGEPLLAPLDDVVDGDDARVREDARALRLADEAGAELLEVAVADREAEAEGLERDEPADQRIARQEDDPHRALAELFEDLVAPEFGRGWGHRGKAPGPLRGTVDCSSSRAAPGGEPSSSSRGLALGGANPLRTSALALFSKVAVLSSPPSISP